MKKLIFFCGMFLLMSSFVVAQDFSYIGAAKCKMCHNTAKSGYQYKIWSESPHAKSLEALKSQKAVDYAKANGIADASKDQKCLKCHSTYHSVKADLIETLTESEGVSCESCHGPGSAYKTMTNMKSQELAVKNGLIMPTKEVCEKCHNKENPFYKPFNFDEAKKKIAHPTPKAE